MAGPMAKPAPQEPKYPVCLVAHDWLNIWTLPLIFALSVAGLTGHLDPVKVTDVFILYIVLDFFWIYFFPHSLPSKPAVILTHHVVTMGLLGFAWCYPEFAKWVCVDGLTEINTWFMVLRRQSSFARGAMHKLYWATYVPLRLVMYPVLVPIFWQALGQHHVAARLAVCFCQLFLCGFNYAVFWLSVRRRLVGRMSLRTSPCDTPRAGVVAKPVNGQLLEHSLDGKLGHALRSGSGGPKGQGIYIRASSAGMAARQ